MENRPLVRIVWLKRDLRLRDHAPMQAALEGNVPVLIVFLFESTLEESPDWSWRHAQFQYHAIQEMNRTLAKHGAKVHVFYEDALEVFAYLAEQFSIQGVYSHQETGTRITYDRDIALASHFKTKNIAWHEYQSGGVLRGKGNKESWNQKWETYMQQPLQNPVLENFQPLDFEVPIDFWATYTHQKQFKEYPKAFQPAGEERAWQCLKLFFSKRGQIGSRLSPYLAWGNLSPRQVYQYYQTKTSKSPQKTSLQAFCSRLQGRCYSIQKFEIEARYEFENLNKEYAMLEQPVVLAYLEAWKKGKTGFPIIDASMRCVIETGYLNSRLRAVLVSFLTHALWQPWQSGVYHLAQQFLDYEAGIHFCQFQMQAGVSGIKTVRIYNPIKQSKEQDAEGVFIRQWLPELAYLPTALLHTPWEMTVMEQQMYHCQLGTTYPLPIINLKPALKKASELLHAGQKRPTTSKRKTKKNTTV